jgi:hypothetical protein
MIAYNEIAQSLFSGDHLTLRSLILDAMAARPNVTFWPKPEVQDPVHLAALAAIIDLLALNSGQPSPNWTREVAPVNPPRHLLKSAERMKNLRALCEAEAPQALRNKGFFAPPNFLQFA